MSVERIPKNIKCLCYNCCRINKRQNGPHSLCLDSYHCIIKCLVLHRYVTEKFSSTEVIHYGSNTGNFSRFVGNLSTTVWLLTLNCTIKPVTYVIV